MISADDFYVFSKWKDAPSGAFGTRIAPAVVPPEDKEAYWRIYSELVSAAGAAMASMSVPNLTLLPKAYSRERGSRGHRPVDLWVSICGKDARAFGNMPQIYAIASDRGLEVGFAASIPESDYFDPEVKMRNRSLVPLINARLPNPGSSLAKSLAMSLEEDDGWAFSTGTRRVVGDEGHDVFGSLEELLSNLKSNGERTGGGAITRIHPLESLRSVDVQSEFELALTRFAPLLETAQPSAWDLNILEGQSAVIRLAPDVAFDPDSIEDGRLKVLVEVARRQGQAKFRLRLMNDYDGACAISGCEVPDVLQAAHIFPYMGPETNHPSNGILLRADIHTLFDLGLIRIAPTTLEISISAALDGTIYESYRGKVLRCPSVKSSRPSSAALEKRWQLSTEVTQGAMA